MNFNGDSLRKYKKYQFCMSVTIILTDSVLSGNVYHNVLSDSSHITFSHFASLSDVKN